MKSLNLKKFGATQAGRLCLVEFDRDLHMLVVPTVMDMDEELSNSSKQYAIAEFADNPSYDKISYEDYADKLLENGWRLFLALVDGDCVGYIHAVPSIYKDSIYIGSFIVSKRFTGKGFGKTMMSLFSSIIKKEYSLIIIDAAIKNIPAMKLYAGSGFKATHQTMIKKI